MRIFETAKLGGLSLKNRIIRSATYEGLADRNGSPTPGYQDLYDTLAESGVGAIITGFTYVSPEGRAMQGFQSGLDTPGKIGAYRQVTAAVHEQDCPIFLQIAHAGRQTRRPGSDIPVVGVSRRKSRYFGAIPRELTTEQAHAAAGEFACTARLAREAGFDGVQVHAAHGYLVHQFLLPEINRRTDIFGTSAEIPLGAKFLDLVIDGIRRECGREFPIIVKVSGSDDKSFIQLIRFLDSKQVAAIEISYGTMEIPLNIIRGGAPIDLVLKYSPIYGTTNPVRKWWRKKALFPVLRRQLIPFSPTYNLPYARIARLNTRLPIICVGGVRRGSEMKSLVESAGIDFVSMCRPFICEPDIVVKLLADEMYVSRCANCNYCTVMCDADRATRCYHGREPGES